MFNWIEAESLFSATAGLSMRKPRGWSALAFVFLTTPTLLLWRPFQESGFFVRTTMTYMQISRTVPYSTHREVSTKTRLTNIFYLSIVVAWKEPSEILRCCSLVEPKGFEPSTSSMPSRRAPNCATAPPQDAPFIASGRRRVKLRRQPASRNLLSYEHREQRPARWCLSR